MWRQKSAQRHIDEKIIDYQITGRTEDIKPELISDNVLDISFIKG